MIKAKHSFDKNSEINEVFIDREEAKELYHSKLNNNQKGYNILVFYGVGGIGKTKLRKEICGMHKNENKEGITFYLDLKPADNRNLGEGILKLVDSCDTKIDFKCFELAYALYFRKKNPNIQYGRDKNMIIDNMFVGIGLNILSIFDSGITGTAAEIVERTIRTITNRLIDKSVKEELKKFDTYTISEIEERLPLFFQYDLLSYLEKHKNTKILMVFDTFEALNENVIEPIHKRRNERWIQDILSYFDSMQFPNLLIMIFGRDKINWGDDWKNLLVQHQLFEFKQNYSEEYLKNVGIDNPMIIKAIVNSSNGYPFLLYLSSETYVNIKNNGKEPIEEDFVGSYPEIIERFIYNLDKDTVEALRLMSVPRFYNKEIFELLIKKFNISFPMTEFDQFNKYSFVTYDNNSKNYYIHDLMKKEILETSSKNVIKQVHESLLVYYSSRIDKSARTKDVLEMFYHAGKSMDSKEFNTWLMTKIKSNGLITPIDVMKIQQKKGEQSILIQIARDIINDFGINELLIDFVNIYIDIVHLGGDYVEAYKESEIYLKEKNIKANIELQKLFCRKIHYGMFWMNPTILMEGINTWKIDDFLTDDIKCEYLIAKYNLLTLMGQFDDALNVLTFAEEISKNLYEDDDKNWLRIQRKKIDLLAINRNEYSLPNELTSIYYYDENSISRYEIYILGSIAENYRQLSKIEEAENYYNILNKLCKSKGIKGWLAHSYLGIAAIQIQNGEKEEAKHTIKQAYDIYIEINQVWGILNALILYCFIGDKESKYYINAFNKATNYANSNGYGYYIDVLENIDKYNDISKFRLIFL